MAPFNYLKDTSTSVKYGPLNTAPDELNIYHDETGHGTWLRRTAKVTGYLLMLCLFVILSVYLYKFTSEHWKENAKTGRHAVKRAATPLDQCSIDESNRFDCIPEANGNTEANCLKRGCCWKAPSKPNTAPSCFFPSNYSGYTASNVKQTATGITATLQRTTNSSFPRDVKTLQLFVEYQTSTRLRVKIIDPSQARYEVPLDTPSGSHVPGTRLYTVAVHESPFNLVVQRTTTGATVFDTRGTAPLVFSDQFLQIATQLSTKYLYGFGEHRSNFLQDVTKWRRLAFWARDLTPQVDNNGYGSHPFFLNLETGGAASNSHSHGVFLLNSNAGEVVLQPFGLNETGAVTYHFIGGILDFYIFLGPDPISVVSQYAEVIGHSYLPPFWSLGYHLCKWGYSTPAILKQVIDRNRQARIPYDVQWNDNDYTINNVEWTFDTHRYGELPNIIKDLHDNHQRYIIIVDPGVDTTKAPGSYAPYDDGITMDVFVKNDTGDVLLGKVWPNVTAFPDFLHPRAFDYWYKQIREFHQILQFDGLWLDMNEPSCFVDGSYHGCTNNELDKPPFTPPRIVGKKLESKTLCPSAKHAISTHYNVHNLYGWSEVNVTRRALDQLYGNKRSLIITRSTFSGSGKHAGHWLGDNSASFTELFYSIPGILNFNLFGIPHVGADICGFYQAPSPELCTRWHQLAAFYPFMRNHASGGSAGHDPGMFQPPFIDYIRSALELRYRLLAVLYNGFFNAHTQGWPIVRPLIFLYPGTEAIDKQFMWNDQLLVSPVVEEGASTVQAFIPDDAYYDFYNGSLLTQKGQTVQLNAPIDHINVHVRGGSILPLLPVTQRTDLSRQEKFQLLVAVGAGGNAHGELFWDDGESADSITANKYSHIRFSLSGSICRTDTRLTSAEFGPRTGDISQNQESYLESTVARAGYNPSQGVKLGSVTFYGISKSPSHVTVNGAPATFNYDASLKVVNVNNLASDLLKPLSVLLN